MEALLQILLILLLAKLFGEASERLGLPSIIGEIAAGLILALTLAPEDTGVLKFFAELGAIFLLFTAGYREVHLSDLKEASKTALIPTLIQTTVAFAFGFILGQAFHFGFVESLFIGVTFSPTSISVVVKTLIDADYLSSKPGSMMLTSAIFDDIIGIFLLSAVTSLAIYDHFPSGTELLTISGKMILFILLTGFIGLKFYPRLFQYVQKMHTKESIFTFVIIIALFSAYIAELFGLHAVIGAFFGGVLLSEIPLAKLDNVQKKVSGLAYGIFTPIFFAFIGLSVELSVLFTAGKFTILVVILALTSKLIGGWIGTQIIGYNWKDSLIFGVGMMPRAGVELVVIAIGRDLGIISQEVFSAIVFMVVASIVISPIILDKTIKYRGKD
jgi:Kef-type K+ transport system membrane component KefB